MIKLKRNKALLGKSVSPSHTFSPTSGPVVKYKNRARAQVNHVSNDRVAPKGCLAPRDSRPLPELEKRTDEALPVTDEFPFRKVDVTRPSPSYMLEALEPFGTQRADPAEVLVHLVSPGARGAQALFHAKFKDAIERFHPESVLKAMFILASGLPDTNQTLGQTVVDHAQLRCSPHCDKVVSDMSLDTMKAILWGTDVFLSLYGGEAFLSPGSVPAVAQVKFSDSAIEGTASRTFIALAAGLSTEQTALTMFHQLINSQQSLGLPRPLVDAVTQELTTFWKTNPSLANQTGRNDHLALALIQKLKNKDPLDERTFYDGLRSLVSATFHADSTDGQEMSKAITGLFGNVTSMTDEAVSAAIEGLPGVPVIYGNGTVALYDHNPSHSLPPTQPTVPPSLPPPQDSGSGNGLAIGIFAGFLGLFALAAGLLVLINRQDKRPETPSVDPEANRRPIINPANLVMTGALGARAESMPRSTLQPIPEEDESEEAIQSTRPSMPHQVGPRQNRRPTISEPTDVVMTAARTARAARMEGRTLPSIAEVDESEAIPMTNLGRAAVGRAAPDPQAPSQGHTPT